MYACSNYTCVVLHLVYGGDTSIVSRFLCRKALIGYVYHLHVIMVNICSFLKVLCLVYILF